MNILNEEKDDSMKLFGVPLLICKWSHLNTTTYSKQKHYEFSALVVFQQLFPNIYWAMHLYIVATVLYVHSYILSRPYKYHRFYIYNSVTY